jgi:hypothetical protein
MARLLVPIARSAIMIEAMPAHGAPPNVPFEKVIFIIVGK